MSKSSNSAHGGGPHDGAGGPSLSFEPPEALVAALREFLGSNVEGSAFAEAVVARVGEQCRRREERRHRWLAAIGTALAIACAGGAYASIRGAARAASTEMVESLRVDLKSDNKQQIRAEVLERIGSSPLVVSAHRKIDAMQGKTDDAVRGLHDLLRKEQAYEGVLMKLSGIEASERFSRSDVRALMSGLEELRDDARIAERVGFGDTLYRTVGFLSRADEMDAVFRLYTWFGPTLIRHRGCTEVLAQAVGRDLLEDPRLPVEWPEERVGFFRTISAASRSQGYPEFVATIQPVIEWRLRGEPGTEYVNNLVSDLSTLSANERAWALWLLIQMRDPSLMAASPEPPQQRVARHVERFIEKFPNVLTVLVPRLGTEAGDSVRESIKRIVISNLERGKVAQAEAMKEFLN